MAAAHAGSAPLLRSRLNMRELLPLGEAPLGRRLLPALKVAVGRGHLECARELVQVGFGEHLNRGMLGLVRGRWGKG